MKKLTHFLIATVFSTNSFAAYWPQDKEIGIYVYPSTNKSAEFHLDIPQTTQFEKGKLYFFRDSDGNLIQGQFVGGSAKNSSWDHMTYVDDENVPHGQGTSIHPNANPEGGYLSSGTHNNAMGAAISTGVAHALYQGVIFDSNFRGEMEKLSQETRQNQEATQNNYKVIAAGMATHGSSVQANLDAFSESLKSQMENMAGFETEYSSPSQEFVQNLRELENILESNRSTVPQRMEARSWGLHMLKQADAASTNGDSTNAKAFVQYAEAFADIAVGFDPITGPIRDTYEAFTGKNLITGEKLDSWARGFAIAGAITFGFGSKIGRGIKAFRNLNKIVDGEHAIQKAVKIDAQVIKRSTQGTAPVSRASYEKMLTELRTKMERPTVRDPKLNEFMEDYWRIEASVGNGSTAAAYRWEKLTGEAVGGKNHTQKIFDSVTFFKKWLKNNPKASNQDRVTVENLLKDIYSSVGW